MNTSLKSWLVLLLLLGTTAYCVAEQVTLTTYYPSPRGVYHELRTLGNIQVGSIDIPAGTAARLHVIGDGVAPSFRVDRGPNDAAPFVIDPEGNVGVGTPTPGTRLDVAGYVTGRAGLCLGENCQTAWPGLITCNWTGEKIMEGNRIYGSCPMWYTPTYSNATAMDVGLTCTDGQVTAQRAFPTTYSQISGCEPPPQIDNGMGGVSAG